MICNNKALFKIPMHWLIAYCLTIPAYIIFFIGKEPIMQGLAFSLYLIPLIFIVVRGQYNMPSKAFLMTWLLFLTLWVTPSLINRMSGRLESDLVSLPILGFHVTVLTVLLLTLIWYLQKDPKHSLESLIRSIFWVMTPMVLLIITKTAYLDILSPTRPSPFGIHPNVAGQIILPFMLTALWLRSSVLKALVVICCVTTAYLLESRATLIGCYIALATAFALPWMRQNMTRRGLLASISVFIGVILLFHEAILLHGSELLMMDKRTGGIAGREEMYRLAIDGIINRPILGNGFWVNPMGYAIPEQITHGAYLNNPANVIHNAFLRIASENGLGLVILILGFIATAIYRLHRQHAYNELAALYATLFSLMFTTRHLTLNLLNVLLYIILTRCLLNLTSKKNNIT